MILRGDHIHGRLNGGVQHFGHQNEHYRHAQQDKFGSADIQSQAQDKRRQRRKEMPAHMPLGLDRINDPLNGKIGAL
jgi:hypothetical protein